MTFDSTEEGMWEWKGKWQVWGVQKVFDQQENIINIILFHCNFKKASVAKSSHTFYFPLAFYFDFGFIQIHNLYIK